MPIHFMGTTCASKYLQCIEWYRIFANYHIDGSIHIAITHHLVRAQKDPQAWMKSFKELTYGNAVSRLIRRSSYP